jgi:hypothetical protein
MLDVFITVDVEIWCDGWNDLDAKFPEAFNRYIYGRTDGGDYGLPFQLKVLADNGLRAVFFVEPLFSLRFGEAPLQDIVGLLRDQGHEIGLHLHTEWVDEARTPILPNVTKKMQHLKYFDRADQAALLAQGRTLLQAAGAGEITSFRAGSFAFNADTLSALAEVNIPVDASYNATLFGPESGVAPGQSLTRPTMFDGVAEYPMAVFDDGLRGLRHAQITSCSLAELKHVVRQCAERDVGSCVILSHNFELLTPSKHRADPIVVRRFEKFCQFLGREHDTYRTATFEQTDHCAVPPLRDDQPCPTSNRLRTAGRFAAQAARSVYR